MTPALALVVVAVVCLLIGTSVGATGYGGFLIPVALVGGLGLAPTVGVYHALLGSVLPTVLAAVLYLRAPTHRPRWGLVGWLSLGTLPGVALGRWVTAVVDAAALTVVLGLVVVAAGSLVLVQARRTRQADETAGSEVPSGSEMPDGPRQPHGIEGPDGFEGPEGSQVRAVSADRTTRVRTALVCAAAGCVGGLTTVLAGVGGPLITVPALLIIGVPVTVAVGSAIISSLVGIGLTLATMIGRLPLEFPVLATVTLAMAVGMVVGVRLHHRLPTKWLVLPVGIISLVTGAWIAVGAIT